LRVQVRSKPLARVYRKAIQDSFPAGSTASTSRFVIFVAIVILSARARQINIRLGQANVD
jgi:hypothetical protein